MKIEIARDSLFDALNAVVGVVERRQTLPIPGTYCCGRMRTA